MKWLVLALPTIMVTMHSNAASFDCNKAQSEIEKMICTDNELSALDESMNTQYQSALNRIDIKDQVIKSQRAWLRNSRNVCQTHECLKTAYESRINEVSLTSSFGLVFIAVPPGGKLPVSAAGAAPVVAAEVPNDAQFKINKERHVAKLKSGY